MNGERVKYIRNSKFGYRSGDSPRAPITMGLQDALRYTDSVHLRPFRRPYLEPGSFSFGQEYDDWDGDHDIPM